MKNLFHRVALIVVMMSVGFVTAQAQNVKGTVKDAKGEPVIGASVIVSGTTNGTLTDMNGDYSLSGVAKGASLTVSFVGYVTRNVPVGENAVLDVVLEEDALMLEDVVVVGYGVQRKSVVTAAIAKVSNEDLSLTSPLRVDNALKGLAAGVTVTSSSGQPGSASKITIRGIGTINNSDPLYIVDGMPIEGGIDYINPNDIESIEVLKDAASGAVYGARAANGVILVTTKKGVKGKTQVNYDFQYGLSSPWRTREVLNASEYALMMNEGRINAGQAPEYSDPYSYGVGTDWQKEVFNYNAPKQQHQLSVSGASDKVNYFVSIGYNKEDGVVGGNFGRSNYERLTLRSNTLYTLFDKTAERSWLNKMEIGANLSYANIKSSGIDVNHTYGSTLASALSLSPILGVFADDATAASYIDLYNYGVDEAGLPVYYGDRRVKNAAGRIYTIPGSAYNEMVNPVAQLSLPASKGWSHKFVGNFNAELQIIDGLKFRSSFGTDLSFWGNDGYTTLYYLGSSNNSQFTSASSESDRGLVWQIENTLTYSKEINRHSFTILLGQSAKKSSSNYLGGYARYLKDLGKPYISYSDAVQENGDFSAWAAPNAESRLASYFGRINYNYDGRYMAEVTVRRDGSSRFGSNNHWATFPSASIGWNLHKEAFMEGAGKWLSNAKIRASWGQNGNENIGNFGYTILTQTNTSGYIFGDSEAFINGVKASGLANQSLMWETSTQTNVGVDLGFWQNSLTFTFDWYKKVTTGMLMTMNIPSYVGESKPIGNVGIMNNSGVEFEIAYKKSFGDFFMRIGANATYLRNKLIEYGNDSGWANLDSFQGTGAITRAQNGMPFPYFYGYKTDGVFQNQAEVDAWGVTVGSDPNAPTYKPVPGDVRFVDINGDKLITDEDRTYIGDGTPDWTWGLNLNLSWKGIDLYMLWQGTVGNSVFDATRRNDISATNLPAYMLGRWTGEGTSDKYPRFVKGDSFNWQPSDLFVYDGSYARLKNIQLGYTLPSKITGKAFIQKLRIFVGAENLWTLTKYHGYDPEISSGATSLGVDYGVYPQPRTFIFGVTVGF